MALDIAVTVARREAAAEDIVLLELVREGQGPLPAFSAGAHIDVLTPSGAVRQYSLCGAPGETTAYQIAVLREPQGRGGSASVHDALSPGDRLTVSAPRNHFALHPGEGLSVLLAAGIGITPLLAMAEELHAAGRPFVLHYCARSEARAAFREALGNKPYAAQVHFHFDAGAAARRLDIAATLDAQPANAHVYTCGPGAFIAAVQAAAAQAGWAPERVHFEHFAGAAVDTTNDGSFEVLLQRSGQVIRVEADVSITQALEANGVRVPVSCEQGVCGTCLCTVLEGEVDHRDMYLTPEEQAANDQMLPCCSRAKSARLVLDL
jgi:vanillate O-demethylase ferredoxin subunit